MTKIRIKIILLFTVFCLQTVLTGWMWAQKAPGGTNYTVELWLKADRVQNTLPSNDANVSTWIDHSGKGLNFMQYNSVSVPKFKKVSDFNYQPSIKWPDNGGQDRAMMLASQRTFTTSNSKSYYIFTVSAPYNPVRYYAQPIIQLSPVFSFGDYQTGGTAVSWTGSSTESGPTYNTYRAVTTSFNETRHGTGDASTGFNIQTGDKKYGIISWIVSNNSNTSSGDIASIYLNGHKSNFWDGSATGSGLNDRRGRGSSWLTGNTAQNIVLGQGSTGTYCPFGGEIMEVIILSQDGNLAINTQQLKKVETYLALKYGLTLNLSNTDATKYDRYINSAGHSVWDYDAAFNNKIFGIGRDDASGLYQKQSKSYEGSAFTAFVGDAVADINVNNNGTLNNMDYVVFGAAVPGSIVEYGVAQADGSINYPSGTLFDGVAINVSKGLNYRKNEVYKVMSTKNGAVAPMTLKLQIPVTTQYVLVSKTTTFAPADTRIYEVKNGIVTINIDAAFKYIDFAGYRVMANTGPGGVKRNIRLWLRADQTTSLELVSQTNGGRGGTWNSGAGQPDIAQSERDGLLRESSVNSWTSIVPGAGSSGTYFPKYEYLAGQNFSNRPGWNSIVPSLNYNAGVTFHRRGENNPSNTVAAEYLVKNSNTAATKIFDKEVPDRVTMIMAMIPEINPNDDATYMLGFGRGNEPGYEATGLMDPLIGVNAQPNGTRSFRYAEYGMAHNDQNANGDGVVGVQSMFDPNSTLIMSYYLRYNYDQAQNDTLKFGINGKYEISDVSREGTGNNNDNYNVARGARVAFNQYASIGAAAYRGRALKGNIGEVIFYEGELSLEETERINSYLSLKYGVTLKMADYGGKFRYKFSDGMVIWDGQNGVFEKNYHNNVAAIGRDDNSDFYNTQAHSTEFNSMLHVGVAGTSLSKDGKSNLGSFDYDKEVVVWGHDGSTGFKSVPQDDCYKFSNVFKRTWIMKKTTNGNRSIPLMVALQDNRSSASSSEMFEMYDLLLPQNEFFMLIADSPGDIAQNIFKEAIPMKYLNGELQCAYTFTNEITYVTFAFNQNIFPCVNSTDKEFKGKKTFDWSQWTRTNNNLNGAGSKTLSKPAKDLNDNIQVVATKIVYDNQVKANNTFPRVVTSPYNGIEIERLGGILNASKVTVTIEFNHPVLPEFFISGLDEWYEQRDRVSITGQCGNVLDDIRPVLSYANARSAGFTISGKTATVNRNGWRSDTDNNGKLNVVFEKPVKTVIIEYTITGKINTFAPQRIFISPFSLSSPKVPAPAPVINEDGLSFTKQVKEKNITTCDEVEYSFYITNTNFTNKFVNFRDVLPDGLTWKGESLGLDTVNAKNMFDGNHLFINPNYGGNRTLIIDSLQIPCTSTVRITATALINGNTVPVGGSRDFSNRAQIEYDRLSNNGQNSVHCLLKSSDRETLDSLTIFNAEWVLVESNLILSQPVINHDSYGPGEEIAVSLTIENKNAATISEMYLNLGFDAGFTFKESSGVTAVNSNGGVVGEVVMTAMDISDPYRTIAGSADGLSGFMLPPGVTTFTFTLVAPQPANLIYETDNQGNPTSRVVPLTTVYRYSTTDYGNFCLAKSINKLTGNFQVSYFSVVIKEIVPSIGPNTGGVYTGSSTTGAPYGIDTNGLVTIKGKGFQNGASSTIIKFGNLNSTNVTVVNDSIITCTPPAVNLSTVWNGQHNTTWNEGWVDVEIFFDAVSNGHLFAKKYFYRAPMTITGVSPDKAPVNGNTQITITGHNFLPPPSYNTGIPMPFEVLFGANPVDTMSVSNDQIVVKTKAHPVKYVDITTDNSIEKYITTGKPFAFYPTVFIKPGKWNEYDKWEDYLSDNILPPAHSVVHIKANCEQNIDVDMDSITVHPSISFTIGAGRMTRANVFSLLDNASFLNNGTDDIGQARVLHNLEKGRNWYVSSPVQGGNTMPDVDRSLGKDAQGQALTSYRVQYYNEPQAYIWHNATGTFETGRGYTAYSENEDIAACFTGKFTNGNQIAPVLQRTNNSAPKQGFNLVGNPFPSYWQWTSATASAANVYSTIWYRTKKAEYEFWTYNASGNISVAPGWEDEIIDVSLVAYIPPMQAFWVRLKDGQSTGTLTFSNSDRSHASNKKNILKAQGVGNHDERPLLRLAVTGDTNTDETVIYADPKAKYGFDTYDSDKMFTNTGVEIFTLPLTSLDKSGLLEHNKLVINGLHAIEGGMEIPIGFQTYQSGIFSFHAKKIQNLDTLGVFLRDRLRGVEFDLCNGGKYDFSAGSTPVTDRFSIVFRSFSATHLTDVEAGDRFLAYTDKEGRIIVSLHSQNAHGGRINISVSDVTGRKLTEQPVTVGEKTILKGVFKKGIYILHTGKWTTKVIVNSNR